MKTFVLSLILALGSTAAWADCRVYGSDDFIRLTLANKSKRIVFFASWCKSCVEHFTDAYAKDSVFVTTYDDEATADKILARFLGASAAKLPCVIDREKRLEQLYKVKFLPLVVDL